MRITIYGATEQESLNCPLGVLPRTEVEALPGWSVSDVLEAAGYMRYYAFALVTAEIESNVSAGEENTNWIADGLFGVEDGGALKFQGEDHISWTEFVRAADRLRFAGDPARIVVYPYGVAGGLIPDGLWDAVQWLFSNRDVGFGVLERLGEAAAGAAGIAAVVRRVRGSRRKQIAEQWRRQGITGPRLIRILAKYQQWDPKLIQDLFCLTDLEAQLMLTNAGYQRERDGLWRPSESLDGQGRRRALEEIETRAYDNIEDGWSDDFPIGDDQSGP